jgi:hypothetical protein
MNSNNPDQPIVPTPPSPIFKQFNEVETCLSELQKTLRETASSIEAHIYMTVTDKLRDLEESVFTLRRMIPNEDPSK